MIRTYWKCLNCNQDWKQLPKKCDCGNVMEKSNRSLVIESSK